MYHLILYSRSVGITAYRIHPCTCKYTYIHTMYGAVSSVNCLLKLEYQAYPTLNITKSCWTSFFWESSSCTICWFASSYLSLICETVWLKLLYIDAWKSFRIAWLCFKPVEALNFSFFLLPLVHISIGGPPVNVSLKSEQTSETCFWWTECCV